jgi:glucose-6-phosphate isomerase
VQVYLDRLGHPELEVLRHRIAERTGRPVTFGWGPRFLHSTGQYHKGGPAHGVFLQITGTFADDLQIPDRPYSYGELIAAQAAGDAVVLAEHGAPVLTLRVTDEDALVAIIDSVS